MSGLANTITSPPSTLLNDSAVLGLLKLMGTIGAVVGAAGAVLGAIELGADPGKPGAEYAPGPGNPAL